MWSGLIASIVADLRVNLDARNEGITKWPDQGGDGGSAVQSARAQQARSGVLVDLFFEEVRAALSNGEQVKLYGFGNFDLRDKKPASRAKPKTVRIISTSSARRVVTFRPAKS